MLHTIQRLYIYFSMVSRACIIQVVERAFVNVASQYKTTKQHLGFEYLEKALNNKVDDHSAN